jgi:hypothetical protein
MNVRILSSSPPEIVQQDILPFHAQIGEHLDGSGICHAKKMENEISC